MQISFFEEFPTNKDLKKLDLVNWTTKLYVAAKSLNEFKKIKGNLQKKYKSKIQEFIYWPILEINEGYWISAFSKRTALKRILDELNNSKESVMLDLELPTNKNPKLYLTQSLNFLRNKSDLKKFIKNYKGQVYLAEYYPSIISKESLLKPWGLHFDDAKVKVIKMVYHSLHQPKQTSIIKKLSEGKSKFGSNYLIAYGTIALGINGDEPVLSAKQLKQDLKIAKDLDIREVVIFRLGGLNKNYIKAINSLSKK